MAVTMGALFSPRRNSGSKSWIRSTRRRSAGAGSASTPDDSGSIARGSTTYSRSPRTRSGARLVASRRRRRHGADEAREQRRGFEHVLAVVQHEERLAIRTRGAYTPAQVGFGHVGRSERLGDRRRHERGVAQRGQFDEHDAHRSAIGDLVRHFQREPCLPYAAGADERHDADSHIGNPAVQDIEICVRVQRAVSAGAAVAQPTRRRPRLRGLARAARTSASRSAGGRSSAVASARTVSACGRRRCPRSSALTACTERPEIVASSSCVKPAASRNDLSCAPKEEPEAPWCIPRCYANDVTYGCRTTVVRGLPRRPPSHSNASRPQRRMMRRGRHPAALVRQLLRAGKG